MKKLIIMLSLILSVFFWANEVRADLTTYVITSIMVSSAGFNSSNGQAMTGAMVAVSDPVYHWYEHTPVYLDGWAGFGLWIPDNDPNYKEMLAVLLTAKTLGKTVSFWYTIVTVDGVDTPPTTTGTMGKVMMLSIN